MFTNQQKNALLITAALLLLALCYIIILLLSTRSFDRGGKNKAVPSADTFSPSPTPHFRAVFVRKKLMNMDAKTRCFPLPLWARLHKQNGGGEPMRTKWRL